MRMVGPRALGRGERLSAGRPGLVEPHAGGEVPGSLPLPVLGSPEGLDRAGGADVGDTLRSTGAAPRRVSDSERPSTHTHPRV